MKILVKAENDEEREKGVRCGPKIGTTEGKHGMKDTLTKVTKNSVRVSRAYNPVVSNIGSRTTNTPADTTTLRVLSHIVI